MVNTVQCGGGCTFPEHTCPILGPCHAWFHLQEQTPLAWAGGPGVRVCPFSCTCSSPTEKRMDRERMSDPEVVTGTSVCVRARRMGLCMVLARSQRGPLW